MSILNNHRIAILIQVERSKYVIHRSDLIDDDHELMHSERQHAKLHSGLASHISPHLKQYVPCYLKSVQHNLVHLDVLGCHRARLLVHQFNLEATLSIITEVELAVLEHINVVLVTVDSFDDLVLLHSCEFDTARDRSFFADA